VSFGLGETDVVVKKLNSDEVSSNRNLVTSNQSINQSSLRLFYRSA